MATMEQLEMAEGPAHEPLVSRAVLGTVLGTIRLALADRALVWAALLAAIAFTGWALADPTMPRLIAAGGYAALVLWPVLFLNHLKRRS
jgi:hypothetical protein